MALTKLEENLNIIENLPDSPNLEPSELKRKFDEGTIKIKEFINETLTSEIDGIVIQIKKDINNKILEDNKKKYYIGKLLFDTKNVNPATYLGFGTWQLWGQGRVPVGINPNDSDFNTVEKTGGEKTHKLTLAEIPSHTHTFKGKAHTHTLNNHTHSYAKVNGVTELHKLTIEEMPSHRHSVLGNFEGKTGKEHTPKFVYGGYDWFDTGVNDKNSLTGGDKAHNHNIKTTTANTGGNSANTSSVIQGGTNTNSGGDGNHNNLQPYITCYIWKRTA